MFGMVLPAGTIGMMLFLNMSWISFGFDLLFKKVEEVCPHCDVEIPQNIEQYDFCPRCGKNRKAGAK